MGSLVFCHLSDAGYFVGQEFSTEAKKMLSKSAKQHRLMEAAAHNPKFAKQAGIPASVAKEFIAADKRKKARAKK